MNSYWKCIAIGFFVAGTALAGLYLGLCALFVITGN